MAPSYIDIISIATPDRFGLQFIAFVTSLVLLWHLKEAKQAHWRKRTLLLCHYGKFKWQGKLF